MSKAVEVNGYRAEIAKDKLTVTLPDGRKCYGFIRQKTGMWGADKTADFKAIKEADKILDIRGLAKS